MRVLASPASCKGVLSAVEAAMALAAGMRTAGLEAEELPVADGGEGTAEVFAAAFGGEWRFAAASDPLGRPIRARYLVLEDGRVQVILTSVESVRGLGNYRYEWNGRELSMRHRTSGQVLVFVREAAPVP